MSDAPEYLIRTTIDFLKVPEDRRPVCLMEFNVWLSLCDASQNLMKGLPLEWSDTFVWIDDGKHHASVHITDGEETITVAEGTMREFAQ